MEDPRAFFAAVRSRPFSGALTAEQVEGLNLLVSEMEAARWPLAHAAYGLATAFHETARTMEPVAEFGGNAYFTKMYDVRGDRPALARANGNTTPGDGIRYRGRGYVQLTWLDNYIRAGRKLGIDLAGNPDLALRPDIAARIMVVGMSEGWFTKKKNADYLDKNPPDYRGARRIINGTDKAALIAGYAVDFERALRQGGYGEPASAPQKPATGQEPRVAAPAAPPPDIPAPRQPDRPRVPIVPDVPASPATPPPVDRLGFWGRVIAAFRKRTA